MSFVKLLYLIIAVLGFFQGLIIAVGLLFKRHKIQQPSSASLFLIVLVLALALENLRISVLNSVIIKDYPLLVLTVTSTGLVFGPLLWFYQYFFLKPDKVFLNKYWLHFLPVLGEISIHIPFYIQVLSSNGSEDIAILVSQFQFSSARMIVQYLSAISLLIYLIFSLRSYYNYLRRLENLSAQPFSHRWLGRFLWFFTALVLYFFGLTLVDVMFFQYLLPAAFYYPFSVLLTVFVYWIGFSQWLFQGATPLVLETELITGKDIQMLEAPNFDQEITQITQYMSSQKPYLDSDLTLRKLAEQLETSPKRLTKILNQGLQKNFFEFVNEYRIEEIKSKINTGEQEHLTLLGIALEAGFNSKSAFNRVFKQQTGLTPKQYQQQVQKITQ